MMAFVGITGYFLSRPAEEVQWEEKAVFSAFFFGAIICLGFSWIFHTVCCHSSKVGKFFNKWVYIPVYDLCNNNDAITCFTEKRAYCGLIHHILNIITLILSPSIFGWHPLDSDNKELTDSFCFWWGVNVFIKDGHTPVHVFKTVFDLSDFAEEVLSIIKNIYFIFFTISCFYFRLDYCGISVLTVGSFVPWLYYCFYCRLVPKICYLALIFTLGSCCTVVSLMDKFQTPKFRPVRAGEWYSMYMRRFL